MPHLGVVWWPRSRASGHGTSGLLWEEGAGHVRAGPLHYRSLASEELESWLICAVVDWVEVLLYPGFAL